MRGATRGRAAATMQLWAGKKKSRYEDDGSRLQGAKPLIDDEKLKGGWFTNFKFGTEVEIIDTTKPKQKKKTGGGGGGGGGGGSYSNTESARFGGDLC